MPTVNLSPVFQDAQLDSAGDPYVGAQLFTYAAGSSTKQTTYTDSAGTVPQSNPIILNSRGEPTAGPIWLTDGLLYKFVLAPPGDTDPPASPIRTIDNIVGINDVSAADSSEWSASGLTPTYVSATSFTLVGDQTTDLHVGRRLKTTNTAGTRYSTIAASAYTSLTTVTVVNDSGTLDSGLSDVALGLISAANTSVPLPDTAILSPGGPLAPFENLVVTRPSAATVTVTADKLVVTATSGRKAVLSSVNVTADITSAGANGLDTGSEAAATWYYLWVVWTGATVAALLSTSATAPTLPSGYTHKGLVGAGYNDGSSNLIAMYQRGRQVQRAALTVLNGGTATSLTQITITAAAPPNARAIQLSGNVVEITGSTTIITGFLAPSNAATFEQTVFLARGQGADVKGSGSIARMLFISGAPALWYRVNAAATDMDLDATGWEF